MENKKIRVGVIGVGNIAENHIAGYKSHPNVELYAFCDINENRLKAKGAKHGVTRLFTNKEDMLALPELDAVSVCTWNSEHAPCTIAALNAGKHVLCEKPMAVSAELAAQMKEAADKNGKLLMIGFVRRFGNDALVLRDVIDQDVLGEVYYAKATYLRRNGNPGGWFGEKQRSGGGPLIDLGVHVLDLVRYMANNPKPVSVYGATFHKLSNRPNIKTPAGYLASDVSPRGKCTCDVEDLASAMVRFDNGLVVSLEASFSLNIKNDIGQVEIFGTKGGARVDPELEIYNTLGGYMTNMSFAGFTGSKFGAMFENETHHFVDCIVDGIPCKSPAQDGVDIMRILDAIYESATTGHEVIL